MDFPLHVSACSNCPNLRTQNRALQLLYDLRYLNIILTAKSEEAKTSRIKHDSRCSVILSIRDLQLVVEPQSCLTLQPCCLPEHPQERCLGHAGQYSLCLGTVTGTDFLHWVTAYPQHVGVEFCNWQFRQHACPLCSVYSVSMWRQAHLQRIPLKSYKLPLEFKPCELPWGETTASITGSTCKSWSRSADFFP